MASLRELEDYFDETARLEIRSDFDAKCVLCKKHLEAREGHFVPLMLDARMLARTIHALYHRVFTPFAAVNGLYACKPCGNQWLMAPDGDCPWGVLVLCIPLMLYAIHILSLANEDAPCLQTLDEIFEDLKENPHKTEEHTRAWPFLNCYQLHPVWVADEDTPPSTTLVVQPTPSTLCNYKQDSKVTRYHILEHDGCPAPADIPPRHVPLYGECEDGAVTLWRIPMRSPGLMFCYADYLVYEKTCNPTLYETVLTLRSLLYRGRGLPRGYRMLDLEEEWAVFPPFPHLSPKISPASSDSSEISAKTSVQLPYGSLPLDHDPHSESNRPGENEASTSYNLYPLPSLSALKHWLSTWFA
ncbi:hypothetical protein PENSPDRAFT_683786 [Peniophora sp. CONT]|nr:hypothetical protein PENSPDRAFT_683786 [Peniophora sp. CONT]